MSLKIDYFQFANVLRGQGFPEGGNLPDGRRARPEELVASVIEDLAKQVQDLTAENERLRRPPIKTNDRVRITRAPFFMVSRIGRVPLYDEWEHMYGTLDSAGVVLSTDRENNEILQDFDSEHNADDLVLVKFDDTDMPWIAISASCLEVVNGQ